ncbi:MAG: hypothetical protein M3Y07_03685 [Acidobacteriota bacterium]|nr:hypothetical protein [Acidobacteriota bacterium]
MLTFERFLQENTKKRGAINLLFEERLFGLVEILHTAAAMFATERIPYELVGGMAVAARIEQVDRDQIMLTRDVDIMIGRSDLDRVKEASERYGFRFRHAAGLDMLLYEEEKKAINGIHLIFAGETVKPDQAPNPALAPERITVHRGEVAVISVSDLVRMKLNSYRDKDRVHVRGMDAVGLITPAVERILPEHLLARLQIVRETE